MNSVYIKTVLRNLQRDKLYASINIVGLAIGVAGFLVAALYLHHEFSYDTYHENADRIYRVTQEITRDGGSSLSASSPQHFAPLAASDFPQIENYVRFRRATAEVLLLKAGDKAYYEENIFVADDSVFDIFSHEIVYGNRDNALVEPQTIALSESMARKYFGDINPVGMTLSTENFDYRVTLVFADQPENTHFKYDALIAYAGIFESVYSGERPVMLWATTHWTYLTFHDDFDVTQFSQLSDEFYQRYMAEFGEIWGQSSRFFLEPLTDIHLYSITNSGNDHERGNIYYLLAFMVVGFFVLGIACINYINLATAKSVRRLKEIALRQLLGAERARLIWLLLSESFVFALMAVVFGVMLVELLFSATSFPDLVGRELSLNSLGWVNSLFIALGLTIIVGLISGLYPAIYLASTKPLIAVQEWHDSSKARLRQFLVLLQFTVSVTVISCVLLMYLQIQYIQSRDLGFEDEGKLVLDIRGADLIERADTFINEINSHPAINGASLVRGSVPGGVFGTSFTGVMNDEGEMENYSFNKMWIDFEYLDVLDIDVVNGRGFDQARVAEAETGVLVNRKLVDRFGWEQPLGRVLNEGLGPRNVIGVVEDFHFQGLQSEIAPLVIFLDMEDFSQLDSISRSTENRKLIVDFEPESITEAIASLESAWGVFDPVRPFQYTVLRESLRNLYKASQNQLALIAIFSVICVLISNLGLFGLTAFSTEQRTKEIGIRKILGASTAQIILMLFRNILKLVLCGSVVAAIISFWAMNEWLDGFYYHTEINPGVFLISALLSLGIAFLTVALQSYKTAEANPVLALRYE